MSGQRPIGISKITATYSQIFNFFLICEYVAKKADAKPRGINPKEIKTNPSLILKPRMV